MAILDSLKTLYSLDTLDARLTTSSTTPSRNQEASIANPKSPAQTTLQNDSPSKLPGVQPSRWKTPEFSFYYLCFLTIPFFMVKSVYDVSKGIIFCFHLQLCIFDTLSQSHIQIIQSILISCPMAGYLAGKSLVSCRVAEWHHLIIMDRTTQIVNIVVCVIIFRTYFCSQCYIHSYVEHTTSSGVLILIQMCPLNLHAIQA